MIVLPLRWDFLIPFPVNRPGFWAGLSHARSLRNLPPTPPPQMNVAPSGVRGWVHTVQEWQVFCHPGAFVPVRGFHNREISKPTPPTIMVLGLLIWHQVLFCPNRGPTIAQCSCQKDRRGCRRTGGLKARGGGVRGEYEG